MLSTSTICSTALIATCISTLAALSIAHDLPGGGLGGKGGRLGGFGVGPGGQGGGLGDKGLGLGGFGVGPSGQGGGLGGRGAFGVGPDGQGGGLGGIGIGPGGQAGGLSGHGGFGVGPGSQAGGLGGLGGLENGQCLASLNGVQGCIQEVLTSILTLQFQLIGPDCCQAILNIDDNCWPKVLPLSPIFPLKNYCTQIVPGFPQPAPPTA